MVDFGKVSLMWLKMFVILLRLINCERSKGINLKY